MVLPYGFKLSGLVLTWCIQYLRRSCEHLVVGDKLGDLLIKPPFVQVKLETNQLSVVRLSRNP